MSNMFRVLVLAAVLPVVTFAYMAEEKLLYVIDGDTAQFKDMRCRFAYVDTPESGDNAKARKESAKYGIPLDKIYKAGRLAKKYVKSRLRKGQTYRIDVKKKGRYGRSICVIYLDEEHTINDMLVGDGFAVPFWRYIPRSKKPHFIKLSYLAKKQEKGLWRIYPEMMQKMAY